MAEDRRSGREDVEAAEEAGGDPRSSFRIQVQREKFPRIFRDPLFPVYPLPAPVMTHAVKCDCVIKKEGVNEDDDDDDDEKEEADEEKTRWKRRRRRRRWRPTKRMRMMTKKRCSCRGSGEQSISSLPV